MTIKIGLHGANGRMGIALQAAIAENNNFSLGGTFARANDDLDMFCSSCEVILDFSVSEALPNLLTYAKKHRKKILIGTTGLDESHISQMEEVARIIPVLHAPNTSIGANLVIEMAGKLAKILDNYDAEIIDLHHKYKQDAPSGTALVIGRNIAASRGQKLEDVAVFDRSNQEGARIHNEIGFSSIRAGSIWGEHEVIFAGAHEIITVGARALSRQVFADGALFAAKWLNSAKPGLYSMKDVLEMGI
jgi:4-hydroxy-tetrahydrodipicolinate reductase